MQPLIWMVTLHFISASVELLHDLLAQFPPNLEEAVHDLVAHCHGHVPAEVEQVSQPVTWPTMYNHNIYHK